MAIIRYFRETLSRAYFGKKQKMDKLTLKAQKRTITGRKVKGLRQQGKLPANIYGKKVKSEAVEVAFADFEDVFGKVGETGLVELIIDGKKRPVLVHNVQMDPVSDTPIHADFLQVDLKEKVTAEVPVELVGEAPAEKQGLGTLVQYIDEIEVEALPGDLPEKFEVDLTKLSEVDAAIQIKDIKVAKEKVDIKNNQEDIIVKIEPLRKEEEVPAAPEAEAAAEGAEPTETAQEGGEEAPAEEGTADKTAP